MKGLHSALLLAEGSIGRVLVHKLKYCIICTLSKKTIIKKL